MARDTTERRRLRLYIVDSGEKTSMHQNMMRDLEARHIDSNPPRRDDRFKQQVTQHVLPVGKHGMGYRSFLKEYVAPHDGFLFLGLPTPHRDKQGMDFYTSYVLFDMFYATSLLVGGRITQSPEFLVQVVDKPVAPKHVFFLSKDYEHLHRLLETFKSPGVKNIPADDMASFAHRANIEIYEAHHSPHFSHKPVLVEVSRAAPGPPDSLKPRMISHTDKPRPKFVVGALCSAFTTYEPFLKTSGDLGKIILKHKWGLMTGGCSRGMMGRGHNVVKEGGGYCAGVTLLDKGLREGAFKPSDLDREWQKLAINDRIYEIGNQSDAIVAMQGGFMSFQELLQFIILKRANHPTMKDKPVIVLNKDGFYDYFIETAQKFGFDKYFKVARNMEQCEQLLMQAEKEMKPRVEFQRDYGWERG